MENNNILNIYQLRQLDCSEDEKCQHLKDMYGKCIERNRANIFNISQILKEAKQFANDTITCLLENKLFNTKNEILTALYIALTDSFLYREIKEKPEKTKKYIEKLETENHELKKSEREEYQKGINLKYYLVIAIAIIITIFFNFVLD